MPKSVRNHLGLKPFDKVEFEIVGDEARVRKLDPTLEDLVGILPPPSVPVEDLAALAKEERARQFVARHD
jgi:bifunctional DNA-binding transcriptional regulator/antitoxin component of YhaV-PrlF toxin-antitoxin module